MAYDSPPKGHRVPPPEAPPLSPIPYAITPLEADTREIVAVDAAVKIYEALDRADPLGRSDEAVLVQGQCLKVMSKFLTKVLSR